MKHWPRPQYRLLERWRRTAVERLLRAAITRRHQNAFWRGLAYYARHFLIPFSGDRSRFPKRIKLELRSVIACDGFFTEDFAEAERGLIRLISAGGGTFRSGIREELHAFFARAGSRSGGAETWNLSGFQLKRFNPFGGNEVESLHLLLLNPSPSFVVLVIIATPSQSFSNRLRLLLMSNATSDVDLMSVRFKPFDLFFSSGSAVIRRQREIDELYLSLNRRIVVTLRKLIRAGFAVDGPLPVLQVYDTNQAADFFSPLKTARGGFEDRRLANAFRALGIESSVYFDPDKFVLTRRGERYSGTAWQVLLYRPSDSTNEKKPRFFYEIFDLAGLLAIEHFHRSAAARATRLRVRITRVLNRWDSVSVRSFLRQSWRLFPEARQALYEQRRMSDERSDALRMLRRNGAAQIKRAPFDADDKATLQGDLAAHLERLGDFTTSTLTELLSTLRDVTDVVNMAVNYRIQWMVTVLAIAALLVAVLALDRDHVLSWLRVLERLLAG